MFPSLGTQSNKESLWLLFYRGDCWSRLWCRTCSNVTTTELVRLWQQRHLLEN